MTLVFGYHGQYLRIDATTGRGELVRLDEPTLRRFIGGVGLGAWALAHEVPAGSAPLGPESALVFALSPLVGSPLTTSAKFAVVGLSPLTGRFCDALSSSHFALAAKRAGVDALVVTGRAREWSVVWVDGLGDGPPRITFTPGDPLVGLPAREAEARLREEHGAEWQVASIGPAGERLVPFANLSHDGRHAGRGGLGAVLGSKRIKALAVRGDHRARLANPARCVELAKGLSARSFGPATAKYRELGTIANLLVFNRFDALPTRNFGAGRFEDAEALAKHDLAPARTLARASCAACTIGCEHIYEVGPGRGVRLEYESLYALGPLCGVGDPELVLRAAEACDRAGLDTISTGGTIAFLMECAQRGALAADRLPSGRPLAFGDGEAVVEAIAALVAREGLGELLALGSRRAAERLGGDAPAFAMHVKGLEMPGYDPRRLPTMALGLAVATRGADHNRSGAYESDFGADGARALTPDERAGRAIASENRSALMDSLVLCKFLRGVFTDFEAEAAEALEAVTGWDVSGTELRQVAERVVHARKCLNQREGWGRDEDTLPERLFQEGSGLTRPSLDALIDAYYRQRGWDESGRVPAALRRAFRLDGPAFGAVS